MGTVRGQSAPSVNHIAWHIIDVCICELCACALEKKPISSPSSRASQLVVFLMLVMVDFLCCDEITQKLSSHISINLSNLNFGTPIWLHHHFGCETDFNCRNVSVEPK